MSRKRKKQTIVPVHRLVDSDDVESTENPPSTVMRWALPATGIALVLISGVLHGLQTNRWSEPKELLEAAARLNEVPREFDNWESVDREMSAQELKLAGAKGYITRTYKHKISQQRVEVMILCGGHGPISLHPPEVCFAGAGWMIVDRKTTNISYKDSDTSLGEFKEGVFQKKLQTGVVRMKTYWAWNSSGKWLAPDDPRFTFAGQPYLYKIYITTSMPSDNGMDKKSPKKNEDDAAIQFARKFLPILSKHRI